MFANFKGNLKKGHLSNPRKDSKYIKAKVNRVLIKNEEFIQISLFTDKQVFHSNYECNEVFLKIEELMNNYFKQAELMTDDKTYFYKLTDKNKLLTNIKNRDNLITIKSQNKDKNYIIKEGMIIPPLQDLGVMNKEGFIVKAYYDKYKQINRFLEIIDDTIKNEKKLNIIDFGCGKSYLTFILYYFLVYIKNMDVSIIGLDLKEDVIKNCNEIAKKYGYNNLKFELGDISLYKPLNSVDMIITLHACDTATDYAMYHAIKLNTKYLLSVPCCQHEINKCMPNDAFKIINKYGILKDRFSAILTDSIRASILEYCGYKVNVMEFIDIENSPKNLLVKAIYTGNKKFENKEELDKLINEYKINQTLYNLIIKNEK